MLESAGISQQVMVMSSAMLEMIKWENNVFTGCVDRYNLSPPEKQFEEEDAGGKAEVGHEEISKIVDSYSDSQDLG